VSPSETTAAELLRADLLGGVAVLLAGASAAPLSGALAATVRETCAALGAAVSTCTPVSASADADAATATDADIALDAAVAAAVAEQGRLDLLAVDGAGLFAEGLARSGNGHAALRACMDGAWEATRATVNGAFLQAGEPGGRVVYLAPAPDADGAQVPRYAEAARAGLENLARTLSIEWARHGIATVTIAPGGSTAAGEVARLVAYLASPAGAYFSGCLLDLRGV
jgi:NAD(P)-dependent dehydrogenase (short-subunit alcohol dehydrogenase family)